MAKNGTADKNTERQREASEIVLKFAADAMQLHSLFLAIARLVSGVDDDEREDLEVGCVARQGARAAFELHEALDRLRTDLGRAHGETLKVPARAAYARA